MIRWLHRKLSNYYYQKDQRLLKKLILKHIQEFKRKWPDCPVRVWRCDEWFVSVGSWEIYKTEGYAGWVGHVSNEYFEAGFTNIFWGVSSSIDKDDWSILESKCV